MARKRGRPPPLERETPREMPPPVESYLLHLLGTTPPLYLSTIAVYASQTIWQSMDDARPMRFADEYTANIMKRLVGDEPPQPIVVLHERAEPE